MMVRTECVPPHSSDGEVAPFFRVTDVVPLLSLEPQVAVDLTTEGGEWCASILLHQQAGRAAQYSFPFLHHKEGVVCLR